MTPDELQATLAEAHRHIARLRNALNGVRFEALAVRTAEAHPPDRLAHLKNIERLVSTGLGERQA